MLGGSKYDKTLKKVQCVRTPPKFRNEFCSIAHFGIDWVPECCVRESGIVSTARRQLFHFLNTYGISLPRNDIGYQANSGFGVTGEHIMIT